jgi:AcrR family transcriptional regulator
VNLHSHFDCVKLFIVTKLRANVPKQERSRLTLHRLLSAAEALLEHGGLDAATVPAIAEAAGVSVGVIYRRFPNKDALLRAVYERFFVTTAEQNVLRLQSVNAAGAMRVPLPRLARGIVKGMIEGYRRRRGLLRALTLYARTHPDASFRRSAQKMNRATIAALVVLFESYRDQIRHPDPEIAIEFALFTLASTLHNILIEKEPFIALHVPENLEDELVRMLFGYLGINESSPTR